MTDEYDAQKDGERSYYVAIECKRQIQQAVTAERDRCARIAEEYEFFERECNVGIILERIRSGK